MSKIRQIHYGDNLPILREMPDECADLIYLDPPFNSNRDYNATCRSSGARRTAKAFRDTWRWSPLCARLAAEVAGRAPDVGRILSALADGGSMGAYLAHMSARLMELRRVLRPEGSVYLHCDPAANGYLRVLMDAMFGAERFRNEIVWAYGLGGSSGRMFSRKHDTIFFYTKGGAWRFDKPLVPSTSARMGGRAKGMTDVWSDIPSLNNMAKERAGYPTQKPLALLERIISASSFAGDVVLDPFCGSGTALVAAENLGRGWIGMDESPLAVSLSSSRLTAANPSLRANSDETEKPGHPLEFTIKQ